MTKISVIGSTGWGTTLAILSARGAHETLLLTRTAEEADRLDAERENARHLPGIHFPETLAVSAEPQGLAEADLVVIAVPSAALATNLADVSGFINQRATVVTATKGVEPETGRRMSEIILAAGISEEQLLALSGPNFARPIAAGLPAATVIAGSSAKRGAQVQMLLGGPKFRVYTSDDLVGVEIAGALKNVVAIACGISDGLGYGENAKAALTTRALAEISRLGVAAGAKQMTFLGLAGLGDLFLTCSSDISRNRQLGLALARGSSLEMALDDIGGVVEGAQTARAIPALAARFAVEMPIGLALHQVLYEGKTPATAVQELMARDLKAETDGTTQV